MCSMVHSLFSKCWKVGTLNFLQLQVEPGRRGVAEFGSGITRMSKEIWLWPVRRSHADPFKTYRVKGVGRSCSCAVSPRMKYRSRALQSEHSGDP